MMKKSIYVGAAVALLLGLLFGRDAASYVRTSVAQLHQSVEDNVPIEFQLERARNMLKDFTPKIRTQMHEIAKSEVQLGELTKEVEKLEQKLAEDEATILDRKADLESGESYIYYGERRYTADQVSNDLSTRFARYKTQDENLNALRMTLRAREDQLEAARTNLDDMLTAQRQLEAEVESMEARLAMVALAKDNNTTLTFDDSHLARTRELVSDINLRIKTEEQLVNNYSEYEFAIPVEKETVEVKDVTKEIADYFGESRPVRDVVHSNN